MSGEELRAMMRAREGEFEREAMGLTASDARRARVLDEAGSRRQRAAWGRGAVAAGAAIALGLGAWAVVSTRADVAPVATPQPSASPSASSTAPVSGIVFPDPLPADGFFLEAARMTDAVWAQVDDGWTLTYWQPSRQAQGDAGVDVTDPRQAAVYLMSPQGERYEFGHFPAPDSARIDEIAYWAPGMVTAMVRESSDTGATWRWLDLTTGRFQTEPVGGLAQDTSLVGWSAYGTILFLDDTRLFGVSIDGSQGTLLEDGGGVLLSPDGTTLAVASVDDSGGAEALTAYSAETGAELWTFDVASLEGDTPDRCRADGWATPSTPAVVCQAVTGPDDALVAERADIYAVGADGATLVYSDAGGTQWWGVSPAADGIVAVGADPQVQGIGPVYYIDRDPIQPWPTLAGHSQWPQLQVLGETDIATWTGGSGYRSVTARDVAGGAVFEVTPALQSDPDWWWTTITRTYLVGGVGPVN